MAEITERNSWFLFAVVVFIVAGAMNIVWGAAAINEESFLTESGVIASTIQNWGYLAVIAGIAQLGAAYLVWNNKLAGGVIAVMIAALSMVFWFSLLGAMPWMAFTIIVLDLLIIYGLIANAAEFE